MFVAATDPRSQDAPPLFAGVLFLLSGFDPPTQIQLSAALEQHGGVNVGEYDGSCTHVIVSRTFLWDDPVCAAARKDGKCLSTELWVSDCLDLGVITDVNHVIYRPLRDSQGILGSKNLVVCLTGYQGQARRNVMRMVHLMGAHFSKPLIANRVTHLVCYKFEGEKFTLAKQLGLKLVNHQWLEDCLKTWALLSEEDYAKSGFELELAEAEAKDSEDDGNLKSASFSPKLINGAVMTCLEGVRGEVKPQTQMEKAETDNNFEHSLHTGRKDVHLSPNLLSRKEHEATAVGDLQEGSPRDAFVCEMQVERTDATLTSPPVLRAKKMKATVSPELVSKSKRQNFLVNADDNGGMVVGASCDPRHGGETGFADEAVCDMQMDRADLGSPVMAEKVPMLITAVKGNENIASMELDFRSPGSEKDEKGAVSPTTGGSTRNAVTCQEENMFSASPPGAETPQTTKGRKHSTVLAIGFDAVVLNESISLSNRETVEGTENGLVVENPHMDAVVTEITPSTCEAKKIQALSSPASTSFKEHKSFLQVNCSSVSKSTEVRRPAKNSKNMSARKSKLSAAQKILCTDSSLVHSSPGGLGVANSSAKGLSPESTMGKAVELAKQGKDLRKVGDKQNTPCKDQDEHACEVPVKETNEVGNVDVHHRGTSAEPAKTDAKVSGSKKKGKPQKKAKLKISEKARLLTVETTILDKENSAGITILYTEKTADGESQRSDLERKVAGKQNMPCNERSTSNENDCERGVRESKLPNTEDSSMQVCRGGKLGQPAKIDAKVKSTKKQGKLSKKSTEKVVVLTAGKIMPDKENAVVHQRHDTKDEPKSSHGALVARKLHETALSTNSTSQKSSTAGQRCFALSGHRQEIKPLQSLVKRLGGKLCRDSHQWSHQTTHLVVAGQLRRTEKFFAAAAAGRWILREDYLKDSSEAGSFLDEKKYEWHGPGMTKDGSISFEAPRKWRELRESTGSCALEGLRVLLYGECIIPSLDTLRRAIRAGGADLVATCPPYTKFLASKVDYAIVNPGTPRNDQWIQEFLNHRVACVTTDFFVDFVCKPSSSLDRHILYDTDHLVQILMTRLQANNVGSKRDRKGRSDDAGEESGGEEICCVTCGQCNREDVMLLCGDDNGSGCGTAMHIDCCKPPLDKVPDYDWYCVKCTKPRSPLKRRKKKTTASKG
eukprot:c15414_g1_i1 orf=516-4046(-)